MCTHAYVRTHVECTSICVRSFTCASQGIGPISHSLTFRNFAFLRNRCIRFFLRFFKGIKCQCTRYLGSLALNHRRRESLYFNGVSG